MIIETGIAVLLAVSAIGAGLMAGVYFAFSGFIMRSFDRLETDRSVDAMNAINDIILRSWFMPLFFGTTFLYLMLAVIAIVRWTNPNAPLALAAGMIYIVGMFFCTVMVNVPLNNRLARANESNIDRSRLWSHYYLHWTRWNHLRTVSSLVACILSVYLLANNFNTGPLDD